MSALFSSAHAAPQAATVKAVIDGDTIILDDARHVRLIGIDTPEMGYKGKPSQPYARQAKKYLKKLIKQAKFRVKLETDKTSLDRYGRTLAHVFLPSGENLNSEMLSAGYATLFLIPPNLKHAQEYAAAQAQARAKKRKRWSSQTLKPKQAGKLSRTDAGFGVFYGEVTNVRHGRSTVWLILDRHLTLKITNAEATRFNSLPLKSLLHKEVEVFGKLYFYKGQPRLRLRHPLQLSQLK